ncbi:MAG: glycosyltransferase [Candidatus Sumerlaeaceae bacterium]|nr:glycosyltransferase [Candidatus Sumerlaeaceae bacterium]
MRIGIDIQTLETFEAHRGIGRLCRQTVDALLSHAPEHEIWLFGRSPTPPSPAQSLLERGARYVSLVFDQSTEAILQRGCATNFLWDTPAARELDLYHVTSPLMNDIVIPASAPCPVVATLLDAIPAVMHERRRPILGAQEWKRYWQRVRTLRTWQAFAAISQTTADDCVRLFCLCEDRVHTTYVPVEQRPLAAWPVERIDATLAAYGLKRGYVLSIMGYHPRKNFEALFLSYARIPSSLRQRAPLVIVCALRHEEKEELLAIARKYRCEGSVVLPGFVPDDDFPAVLAGAAVLIFPSRYEGFGLPVAEAMAAGVPVVASNTSSLPEVVGEAGILCNPDDHRAFTAAILRLVANEDEAKLFKAMGFMQVAKFSPERFVQRLLKCYDAAVSASRSVVAVSTSPECIRVAVFSPLSPKLSGIADFTEQLMLNFSDRVVLSCFIDDFEPSNPLVRQRVEILPHWVFDRLHKERPYDVILYELGNNLLHAYSLPYLERYPGIVDLHDFSILGLFQYLARDYGWVPEAVRWIKRESVQEANGVATEDDIERLDPLKVPLTRWLLNHHRVTVVHSKWLADHLAPQTLEGESRITYIPLGVDLGMVRAPRPPREELRRKYHLTSHAFVVACVGVMNRLKRLPQVIAAFREFNLMCPESYLVFVGPADRLVLREVMQLAAKYRIKNRLRLLGHRPLPELYEVLDVADVVVNLRYPTMGESSATLVAALAMGKPALVTPLGQYLEFPDDVCLKVPPNRREKHILYEHLCRLYRDRDLCEQMGENARKHVEAWAYHLIAAHYEKLFDRVKAQRQLYTQDDMGAQG